MSPEIRELKKVLQEINGDAKNLVAKCLNAGKLLAALKEKTKHGDWQEVLEAVELSKDSAQRYIGLWEHRSKLDLKQVM